MALTNAQMLFGTPPAASDTGYQIPRSLRFVMGDSTRLYKTFTHAGDLRTGTHSFWLKKVDPAQAPNVGIVSSKVDSNTYFDLHWENTAQFAMINMHTYPSDNDGYSTIPQFRDPGGWTHYCVIWDTRDTTAISRFRMFLNGKEYARTGISNWEPTLNSEGYWGRANIHEIGRLDLAGWGYMNGYMADYRYIDGWKPTVTNGYISDLGEIDSDTGVWVPTAFTMPQNPNAVTTFSSTNFVATISGWASSGGTLDKLFNGIPDPGNWTQSATTSSTSSSATWDLGSTGRINNVTSMRIQVYLSSNQAGASNAVKINGTDVSATCLAPGHSAFHWIDLADHEFTYLQSIYIASSYIYISGIEINGIMLIDGAANNSFHLRYANDTNDKTLGFSAAQANISSPTILDDMGSINEDPNSDHIQIAVPMYKSALYVTDVSADIKGSGTNKTVSNNGNGGNAYVAAATSTFTPAFYDGSAKSDGTANAVIASADYTKHGSSDDWTMEWWGYYPSSGMSTHCRIMNIGADNGSNGLNLVIYSSGNLYINTATDSNYMVGSSYGGGSNYITDTDMIDKWCHFALSRNSGVLKAFINGRIRAISSSDTSAGTSDMNIGGSGTRTAHYIQDFRYYVGVGKYGGNSFIPPKRNDWNTAGLTAAAGSNPTIGTIMTVDSTKDSPINGAASGDSGNGNEISGNYATWNPVWNNDFTYSQGNLKVDTESGDGHCRTTLGMVSGQKFYAEFVWVSGSSGMLFGVVAEAQSRDHNVGQGTNGWGYYSAGSFQTNSSDSGSPASWAIDDVIGVALDLSAGGTNNGVVTFYKNGVSQGAAFSNLDCTKTYFFACNDGSSSGNGSSWGSFGQKIFKYAAPAGYKCLCSSNLASKDQTIKKGLAYFDVKTWNGNGSAGHNITGYEFQPDMVWLKRRDALGGHHLRDVIRGATKSIFPNTNEAQGTDANIMSAFLSNGFTLGNGDNTNNGSGTYVGWAWDCGDAASGANNDGSINISAGNQWKNTKAGFSITKYVSNNTSGATVGHGLGAAPELIIVKNTEDTNNWNVYHKDLGNTHGLYLDLNNAKGDDASLWNDTSPTSTVFSLGNGNGVNNASSHEYMAYAWTSVIGYSKISTYEGDNTTQHFIYTGFKPAFVLIKDADAANNWYIYDRLRERFLNPHGKPLFPDDNYAEQGDSRPVDLNANGFTLRNASWINTSGNTHVYAAFASSPLSLSNAH